MKEREVDDWTVFVPLAEQKESPKIHTIHLPTPFAPLFVQPPSGSCPECHADFTAETIDYTFGWGDKERLECVVPNTPALACECGKFIDEPTRFQIMERSEMVCAAVEDEDEERISALADFLNEQDVRKVRDFALNRWLPYSREQATSPDSAMSTSRAS
jgi:hypothetical protein